jgi:hypothetical protein
MRMRSRLGLTGWTLLCGLLAACANSGRQALPAPGAPPPAPVEMEVDPMTKHPDLLFLPGRFCEVHYVPGSLDRAAYLQQRIDRIAEALAPLATAPPVPRARVLDAEHWAAGGYARAWGLPEATGPLEFAVAAEGDTATVARMRDLTGGFLPRLAGEPLRGSADEAASLIVADAILQTELAAGWARRIGVRGGEPWVDGVVTQLLARLAWELTDPGQMPNVADLFDRIAVAHGGLRTRRLEDYRAGLPLEEELWYQAQFLRGADRLWVEKGNVGTRRWLREVARRNRAVTADELLDRAPDLAAWRAESFAP